MYPGDKIALVTRVLEAETLPELKGILLDLIALLPLDEELDEELEKELRGIAYDPNQ